MPETVEENRTSPRQAIEAQLEEALDPEMVEWDPFKVGDLTFKIKPLVFKWDQHFRKYAMPIVGAGLQPLEMLIAAAVGDAASYKVDLGISRAVIASELEIDALLPMAVGAICSSQAESPVKDPARVEHIKWWAEKASDEMSREEMVRVVDGQLAVQKAMSALGKSLSTRFKNLAALVDKKIDLSSLVLASTQRVMPSLEPSGPTATTSSSSSGDSTVKRTTSI